jgi:hypothetical protein
MRVWVCMSGAVSSSKVVHLSFIRENSPDQQKVKYLDIKYIVNRSISK